MPGSAPTQRRPNEASVDQPKRVQQASLLIPPNAVMNSSLDARRSRRGGDETPPAAGSFVDDGCGLVLDMAIGGGVFASGFPSHEAALSASPTDRRRLRAHPDADADDLLDEKPPALAAYEHSRWLRSRGARIIRIMSEFMHTGDVLKEKDVVGCILFLGSARLRSPDQIEKNRKKLLAAREAAIDPVEIEKCSEKLNGLERVEKLAPYYDKIADLGELCAAWSKTKECEAAVLQSLSRMPSLAAGGRPEDLPTNPRWEQRPGLVVATGGGPGAMEAANRGAARVEGGRSMGLGVVLPRECGANPWVDDDLNFKYHYFFTRKFWMVFMSMAVVACPGGFGTFDELLELLTLRQTGKFKVKIPIVLFGAEFWRKSINFEYLVDVGVISQDEVDSMFFTDSPQDAFDHIRNTLLEKPMYEGPSRGFWNSA